MSESIDAQAPAGIEATRGGGPEPEPTASGRRGHSPSARRREWRTGGTSVQRWGWLPLGWAIVGLGAGVLVSAAATRMLPVALGGWIGQVALWLGMLVPVVLALRISVPRGLFRFRFVDLLSGLVMGVALRVVSGWLQVAATGTAAWPSYATTDGRLSSTWWIEDLALPVLVGPAVEELFFHALLLVALYTVFRRLTDARAVAGVAAALVSTGLFLLLHQLTGSLAPTWDGAVAVGLVGLVGAALVLLTGRFWPALVLHIVFNGSYVPLALVGTFLGVGSGAATLS